MSDFEQLNNKMTQFAITAGQAIGKLQSQDKKHTEAVKLLNKAVEILINENDKNALTAIKASQNSDKALTQVTAQGVYLGSLDLLAQELKDLGIKDLTSAINHLLAISKSGNVNPSPNPNQPSNPDPNVTAQLANLQRQIQAFNISLNQQSSSITSLSNKVGTGTINSGLGNNLVEAVNTLATRNTSPGTPNPPQKDFTPEIDSLKSGLGTANQSIQANTQSITRLSQSLSDGLNLSGLGDAYNGHKSSVVAALNHVMSEAKIKGGSGGGGNNSSPPVDLSPINNRLTALEQKDTNHTQSISTNSFEITQLKGTVTGLTSSVATASQSATTASAKATQAEQTANLAKQQADANANKLASDLNIANLSQDYTQRTVIGALNQVMTEAKQKGSTDLSTVNSKIQALELKTDLSSLGSEFNNNKDSVAKAITVVMNEAKKKGTTDLSSINQEINTIKGNINLAGLSSHYNGHKDSIVAAFEHVMEEAKRKPILNTSEYSKKITALETLTNITTLSSDFGSQGTIAGALNAVMVEAKNKGNVSVQGKTVKSIAKHPYQQQTYEDNYRDIGDIYKFTLLNNGQEEAVYIPVAQPAKLEISASANQGKTSITLQTSVVGVTSEGNTTQQRSNFADVPAYNIDKFVIEDNKLKFHSAYYNASGKLRDSDRNYELDLSNLGLSTQDRTTLESIRNKTIVLNTPTKNEEGANKKYVDDRVEAVIATFNNAAGSSGAASGLVLSGRAQYATCKLAPFDGGGNAAGMIKNVIKSNDPKHRITFSNELSFQTTRAGWYKIEVMYTPNGTQGIFLNNGVAKYIETTAPLFAEDSYPPTGYMNFIVKVAAGTVYRTNLADKTKRDQNILNVHFCVEFLGD